MDIPRPSLEQERHDDRLVKLYEALQNGQKIGIDPETAKELGVPEEEGQSILEYLKALFQIK